MLTPNCLRNIQYVQNKYVRKLVEYFKAGSLLYIQLSYSKLVAAVLVLTSFYLCNILLIIKCIRNTNFKISVMGFLNIGEVW